MLALDDHDVKLLRLAAGEFGSAPCRSCPTRWASAPRPVARRIKRLEEAGIIRKRVALLEPDALGAESHRLFIFVRTNRHDAQWLDAFSRGVARLPEGHRILPDELAMWIISSRSSCPRSRPMTPSTRN